jgi:hypothetical protein
MRYAQLRDLNSNIVGAITSRKIRRTRHVKRVGDRRGTYRVLVGKPQTEDCLEDQGVDVKIILKNRSSKNSVEV